MASVNWAAALRAAPADLVITYDVGLEWGPHRDGRTVLKLRPDGSVNLENPAHGENKTYKGTLADGVFKALVEAMIAAGFPNAPELGPLPPGETIRVLLIESGGRKAVAELSWHGTAKLPLWSAVFEMLDAMVRQVSGGALLSYPDKRPGLLG